MSRRKLAATLMATAAVATPALPVASASAAVTPVNPFVFTPSFLLCSSLVRQVQFALLTGQPLLANALAQTFIYLGCGGAAI